jgi:hypothetical protein
MKESLEKIIRKVILKKYPWINHFTVKVTKTGKHNYYSIRYYTDNEDGGNNVIESDTKNLFNVLGPDKYDLFSGVDFFSREGLKMEESLKILIEKSILPKYDWIKDFNVTGIKDGVQNLYTVRYYVDDDLYNEDDRNEINRIKSETKNLYNSLGPSEYDFLNGLSFSSYWK